MGNTRAVGVPAFEAPALRMQRRFLPSLFLVTVFSGGGVPRRHQGTDAGAPRGRMGSPGCLLQAEGLPVSPVS